MIMSADNFRVEEHIVPGQHIREYPNASHGDDDILETAVKHYVPRESRNDGANEQTLVTIIGAHANGIPKVRRPCGLHATRVEAMSRSATSRFTTRSCKLPKPTALEYAVSG